MRTAVCALAVVALATSSALAQADRGEARFWKAVQATCDATAAKPAGELGQRIARSAIDEFYRFGGHEIDANGRLFRFGVTEAEHEEEGAPSRQADLGRLAWWRVMEYWRALYGDAAPEKLEVRGYRDASTAAQSLKAAPLLRTNAAALLRDADGVTDPAAREILREAVLRAAIIDTPWSAAFISYVVRQAGVTEKQFQFSNAHRAYIYDAFATSTAERNGGNADDRLYRACPLTATRPRPGDLICAQYEPALENEGAPAVRERIREELDGDPRSRTIRRTHCEVVASVDTAARKLYAISGNVYQSVAVRKLNLGRDLRFSPAQSGHCGGAGDWTLPKNLTKNPDDMAVLPKRPEKCSLNGEKWFVLLQMR